MSIRPNHKLNIPTDVHTSKCSEKNTFNSPQIKHSTAREKLKIKKEKLIHSIQSVLFLNNLISRYHV